MKAIVTIQNDDNTYNEVGMSTRMVASGTYHTIKKRAKEFARGKPHRIELYNGSILGKIVGMEYVE